MASNSNKYAHIPRAKKSAEDTGTICIKSKALEPQSAVSSAASGSNLLGCRERSICE